MERVVSVATALPPYRLPQDEVKAFAREHFDSAFSDIDRLLSIFDHAGIEARHVCVPIEWFRTEHSFAEKNQAYIDWATRLGFEAGRKCLEQAGVAGNEVGHLIFVSTTGLATPSIDARLIPKLGLPRHATRTPIWGLGCGGGAAGLAHAHRTAKAEPGSLVLLVAVEATSLTFLHRDRSKANLVATALFGDGAAAVLIAGSGTDLPGLEIVATRCTLFPDSLDVMGWNFMNDGMQVVFSREIPAIVRRNIREDVRSFLLRQDLDLDRIAKWIAHPGGVKVIQAYEEALGVSHLAMEGPREVLRKHGNMSSASVLFVLDWNLRGARPAEAQYGILTSLGPGFSSDQVLLKWNGDSERP